MKFLRNIFNNKNPEEKDNNIKQIAQKAASNKIKTALIIKIILPIAIPVIGLLLIIVAGWMAIEYVLDFVGIKWEKDPPATLSQYNGGLNFAGSGSATFNNSYTKEDFVQAVEAYNPPNETYSGTGKSTQWGYETFFKSNAENFYDIATSYGMDPRFIFSIGIHESYYGTSNIALEKGNFFGWGAYDSSPYSSAYSFYDMSEGIETVSKGLATTYVDPNGQYHQSIVNKGYDPTTIEGIGSIYASDPQWAEGVKGHMQKIFGSMTLSNASSTTGSGTVESVAGDGYTSIYTSSSGKKYKEFKQNSGASYSGMRYANSTIAKIGCSVTSLAIAASGYGYDYTPAHWSGPSTHIATQAKTYAPGSTLTNTASEESYASFNVQDTHKKAIQDHLKTGNPVIFHVLSDSSYTTNQHWMVLLDISEDGSKVYVSNPNVSGHNGWDDIDHALQALCCYIRLQP